VGITLYLTGAVGVDIITNSVPKTTFASQGLLVATEEFFELLGGILFLYALTRYIETYFSPQLKKARRELER